MKYDDLTNEQLRRIDKRVAQTLGLVVVYDEWPCGYNHGCGREANHFPDIGVPPYFTKKPRNNWQLESVYAHVYDDGSMNWPPKYGYCWVEPVTYYTEEIDAWYDVERYIEKNNLEPEYARNLLRLTGNTLSYTSIGAALTAPLHVRCIAFLMTCGVDVDGVLKETK